MTAADVTYIDLIRNVYQKHKPKMLADLQTTMAKHVGEERKIYEFICKKYNEFPGAVACDGSANEARANGIASQSSTSASRGQQSLRGGQRPSIGGALKGQGSAQGAHVYEPPQRSLGAGHPAAPPADRRVGGIQGSPRASAMHCCASAARDLTSSSAQTFKRASNATKLARVSGDQRSLSESRDSPHESALDKSVHASGSPNEAQGTRQARASLKPKLDTGRRRLTSLSGSSSGAALLHRPLWQLRARNCRVPAAHAASPSVAAQRSRDHAGSLMLTLHTLAGSIVFGPREIPQKNFSQGGKEHA
jgi:hypothetical protein